MGMLNNRTQRMNKILVRVEGRKRAREEEMTTGPEMSVRSPLLCSGQQGQSQEIGARLPQCSSPPFKHHTPMPISTLTPILAFTQPSEMHPSVTPLPSQFEPLLGDPIPVATRGWQC